MLWSTKHIVWVSCNMKKWWRPTVHDMWTVSCLIDSFKFIKHSVKAKLVSFICNVSTVNVNVVTYVLTWYTCKSQLVLQWDPGLTSPAAGSVKYASVLGLITCKILSSVYNGDAIDLLVDHDNGNLMFTSWSTALGTGRDSSTQWRNGYPPYGKCWHHSCVTIAAMMAVV